MKSDKPSKAPRDPLVEQLDKLSTSRYLLSHWSDITALTNSAPMIVPLNEVLELRILPCFRNGIICTTALGKAVAEKLDWLKRKREASDTSDADKKKIDDEVDHLLGSDLGKSFDTVKANLVDRLTRWKQYRDAAKTNTEKRDSQASIDRLQPLLDNLNTEGRPK